MEARTFHAAAVLAAAIAAAVAGAAADAPAPQPAQAKPAQPAAGAKASAYTPIQPPKAKPKPPKGPEQISGRLSSTRLGVVRKRNASQTMNGRICATISSDQPRFKRPVLYIAALFDVDGMWRMYDVTCCEQKTGYGRLLAEKQTPAQISKWQPEVSKDAWTNAVYGDPKLDFFYDAGISGTRAKLIGYRLELWQNGGLVDSFDSNRSAIRQAGAPEDWYVKGKYPGKIVYRWPPPPAG